MIVNEILSSRKCFYQALLTLALSIISTSARPAGKPRPN